LPTNYSLELRQLVGKMLSKDQTKRPTATQILQTDLCKKAMLEFVKTDGQSTIPEGKTIYKKARPTIVRSQRSIEMEAHLDIKQLEAEHNA
jgi:hypothetical protein